MGVGINYGNDEQSIYTAPIDPENKNNYWFSKKYLSINNFLFESCFLIFIIE
jgi:hypothetical protein